MSVQFCFVCVHLLCECAVLFCVFNLLGVCNFSFVCVCAFIIFF